MARLQRLFVYPIKSLDGTAVETTTVVENGGLERDRRYAIVDENGDYVNGKREPAVHRLRATYDLARETVTLESEDRKRESFHLEDDREAAGAWLSEHFGYPVELIREDDGGFPDDTDAPGPTVIAVETVRTVASWFDGIGPDEMRRRLRPNLLVGGVEPFWDDRLYDRPGTVVPFEIGDVAFRGVNPCQRCVVPTRDPDTGAETPGFRERFVQRREATLPEWANRDWFDHHFRLMVNTRVARDSWGASIATGDRIAVGEPVSEPAGDRG